jgi:glycerol-3-phosphate dehydrogenase
MVARSRIGHTNAITFLSPVDGRVMFILPWGDRSYIGTTDSDSTESPDDVAATSDDVLYLLRSANALFPAARLSPEDVSLTWAGLRPLLAGIAGQLPGLRSREHLIVAGPRGLISVAGGKLTTFRRMAIDALDFAARQLNRSLTTRTDPMSTRSATEPLPGGDPYDQEVLFQSGRRMGFSEHAAAHLVGQYGSETPILYQLAANSERLRARLHPAHGAIGAQVVYAVQSEFARRLDDVMFRRLSIGHETPDGGFAAAAGVAKIMAEELGWDETTRRLETDRYYELAQAMPVGRG